MSWLRTSCDAHFLYCFHSLTTRACASAARAWASLGLACADSAGINLEGNFGAAEDEDREDVTPADLDPVRHFASLGITQNLLSVDGWLGVGRPGHDVTTRNRPARC